MTDAVIQGVYADIKNVKTRSSVQIIVEVPIEQAGHVQQVLGWPQPGSEIPVVVARLTDDSTPVPRHATLAETYAGKSRKFDELPLSQQAALACQQEPFQTFMDAEDEIDTAILIRFACGVTSRSEIKQGTPAGEKWLSLWQKYKSRTPF